MPPDRFNLFRAWLGSIGTHTMDTRCIAIRLRRLRDDPVSEIPPLGTLVGVNHADNPKCEGTYSWEYEKESEDTEKDAQTIQKEDGNPGADISIHHRPDAGEEEGDQHRKTRTFCFDRLSRTPRYRSTRFGLRGGR